MVRNYPSSREGPGGASSPMSALGHSRPGPVGRRASHVRYAPKATVGHQNAIGRDGPKADILRCSKERRSSITSSARTINDRGTLGPSGLGGLKPDHQLVRISRKTGTANFSGPVQAQLVAKSDNLRWRTT
jgi:hypothetical protein